jgi:FAD/FMN-containing dehydrogenase/Fe-S oxidoreductase
MARLDLEVLSAYIDGELAADMTSRRLYATDASIYQQIPMGVVYPRNETDCVEIVKFATTHGYPLIPRAAGTSLAGQCVGEGLVVDVSRHMTSVSAPDVANRRVTVGPGVVLDDLNDRLVVDGLFFGPDASTSNRCTIGGMIGNNACGSHSIYYGTTRDHVVSMRTILHDGSVVTFGDIETGELTAKLELDTLEGAVYRSVYRAVEEHRDAILAAYPNPEVTRRNTGYPLDVLAMGRPWVADGRPFNLARFLCGTEGTLALTTEATLDLDPVPQHKLLVCAHFRSLDESMQATVEAVRHSPAAIELIDRHILEQTRENLVQARNRFWVEGDPEAVLVIELYDDQTQRLRQRADALEADLRHNGLGYAFVRVEPPELERVWALRKAGLGVLMGEPGDDKAVTVIEDAAVPVSDLPAYVREIEDLMERYETKCVYYAHASVGLLHLRPELNLGEQEGIDRFRSIAAETAAIVKRYGGSLSGEHGDGRLRGPFVEQMLGSEVFGLLRQIKAAFDPKGLFNPGKIFDAEPIDVQLRIHPASPRPEFETVFDWSADHGLLRAAEKCNGAGACRKSPGRGTMCPSYMATRDERDTTRARANLFRQVLSAAKPAAGFADEDLKDVLDLCVSCKGCRSECPANVDMARMKAEFLQHWHDHAGVPLRSRLFGEFPTLTKLAKVVRPVANLVLGLRLSKRLMGVHESRTVPPIARQTFGTWARRRRGVGGAGKMGGCVLLNDSFTHFNDPHVGKAAVKVLEHIGYEVEVTGGVQSGRTQLSKGLVRRARKVLDAAVVALDAAGKGEDPIVGIEPSAILTFRDEAPDLVSPHNREAASRVASRAMLLSELLARDLERGDLVPESAFSRCDRELLLHGHCHEKAIAGTASALTVLRSIPGAMVREIPSGCCGMAGSFGYEEEHYDISMRIGELVLFPAVRRASPGTVVVASGTSCRHQIYDGTGVAALHIAEVLAEACS